MASKMAVMPFSKEIKACVIPGPRMCGRVRPATAETRRASKEATLNGTDFLKGNISCLHFGVFWWYVLGRDLFVVGPIFLDLVAI